MKIRRNLRPVTGHLDLAPFAGVFFLLVLLLLLQSSLAPAPGLRISLPAVGSSEVPDGTAAALVVAIDQNELLYFDHQVIGADALHERLAARVARHRTPLTLMLQADEAVRQGAVVRVATLARSAGIHNVIIATRPPLLPPPGRSPPAP
ncbi:MAG TPA: biopolymer transporter ExbD [Verrucomicrobiota bacterium]|nr:biopolymer transporter ExbD [Verrucomicrobiota bacterium]HNU50315.1 biopolymer transporter ExbD [Verrucomicrobiota bacterium]